MARPWGTIETFWPVTLTEGSVVLRPFAKRDEKDWNRIRLTNRAWLEPWEATLPSGGRRGPGSFRDLVKTYHQQAKEGRMLPWALCYRDPSSDAAKPRIELAGQLTVSNLVGGSAAMGSIGYWIDERFAGRGMMPTAVALACDYCFQRLGMHRIEIAIRPENHKSLQVVRKLGLREEGLRPRFLHIRNDWRDHLIFAVHAEEAGDGLVNRMRARRGQ